MANEGREHRISVRIDADLRRRLDAAKLQSEMDEPDIIKLCVKAFCKYVEQHGEAPAPPFELRLPRATEAQLPEERVVIEEKGSPYKIKKKAKSSG